MTLTKRIDVRSQAVQRAAWNFARTRVRRRGPLRIHTVARTLARGVARVRVRAPVRGLAPAGPRAVYARILDGTHLWLAVRADDGRPALWDPVARTCVDVVDDLPSDHVEHDAAYVSVRWRLTDAVPEQEDATLLAVLIPAKGGRPKPLRRPPSASAQSRLRPPPTPDGRWQFALHDGLDGVLRVRRKPAAMVRLLAVEVAETTVVLACSSPQQGPLQLLFVSQFGSTTQSVPTERRGDQIIARLGAADMPAPGSYRLALGTPTDHLPITRRHNDLALSDWTSALMPDVLDPERTRVVGSLVFTRGGELQLNCRRPDEATDLKASA